MKLPSLSTFIAQRKRNADPPKNLRRPCATLAVIGFTLAAATSIAQSLAPPEVTPEKVRAALPGLERVIEQIMKKTGAPGLSIAIVYKDQVAYLKGFGAREIGKDAPVDADTVFQLASVSKPIASTVVAGLVGDKAISWDDPVIRHDPGFQMNAAWVTREVTLRDLFAHRSGLADHAGDLLEDLGYDRATILSRLHDLEPGYSFRSGYAYTNFGLTEAAVAAAKAAGKSWEELSAERLYRPVGMTRTSSRNADFENAPNHASLHVILDDKWVAKYKRDPDAQSPAGGVSSTARDMAQWLRLQLAGGKIDGKQIIAQDALAETHRPQVVTGHPQHPDAAPPFYGLGWDVSYDEKGRVHWNHSGAFDLGAATTVSLLPSEDLGIVVLTNGYPIGVPEAISRSFFDLAISGKVEKDWLEVYKPLFAALTKPEYGGEIDYTRPPARPAPPLAPDAYLGAYDNEYFGEIEVVAKNGGLRLRLGPKKTEFPMTHYDRDVFFYQPVGENAAGPAAITFTVGANGKASGVEIENLKKGGQGVFMRQLTNKAFAKSLR
jgi:CubicO group peptidase (beta-lactamase class C family)